MRPFCLFCLLLASCGSKDSPIGTHSYSLGQSQTELFPAFWPVRTANEIQTRLHAAAEVIAQQQLSPVAVSAATSWTRPFQQAPYLALRYDSAHDEMRMFDGAILLDQAPGKDIGEPAARSAMLATLADLNQRGLLDLTHFDPASAELSFRRAGYGSRQAGAVSQWVVEYRYKLLRRLGGVEFVNAYVVIGIHRTGVRSSLRLGGAKVSSSWVAGVETPLPPGSLRPQQVAIPDIRAKFFLRFATQSTANVIWEKVLYAIDDEQTPGIIEPRYVIAYAPTTVAGGKTVVSPRRLEAFSLLDAKVPSKVLQSEAPTATIPPPPPK